MQGKINVVFIYGPIICCVETQLVPVPTVHMSGDSESARFEGTYTAKLELLNANGQIVNRLMTGNTVADGMSISDKKMIRFAWEGITIKDIGDAFRLQATVWEVGVAKQMGSDSSSAFDIIHRPVGI